MALKSFTETLEKELTCSLCLDVFTQPKTLPCLHSYCTKCIVQWYQTSGDRVTKRFSCPMCKTKIAVPDGDVSKLRSSFYFDSLLQLVHAMKTKANQTGLSDCVSCEKPQELVAFCPQCSGLICGECVDAHKAIKQLREHHQPTMLNQFKQENVDVFIKNQMFCKEKFHEKNKLEYYCHEKTCQKCVCQKCAILYHQNHRMQSLEEAADDVKQEVQKQMHQVQQLQNKYHQELEQSKKNMQRIQKEIEVAKKEVDDAVERICKMAREHGRVMKHQLDQTLQEQTTANDQEQTDIKTGKKRLADFSAHWQRFKDRGPLCELMESKDSFQQTCQQLLRTPSMLCSKPIVRNVTVGYVTNKQVMQSLVDIGKIVKSVPDPSQSNIESSLKVPRGFVNEFQIITRNAERELCPTRIESLDIQIKDGQGNEVKKDVLEEQTGKYRVKYKAEKDGQYTIQVNIGGEPINNSPQNVNILDVNELFEPLRTFGGKGSGKGQLNGPWSIAVSDNGEIAITGCDNHRIQIFTLEGNFLREFGSEGQEEGQLYYPFGVVFKEDRIIISDGSYGKGRIQEFYLNGSYVRTIYRPQQWFTPCGMCVNDDKNIAVCCEGNEELGIKPSIKVFSKQGLVKEFYMPDNPCFITYGNGKYFVSCGDKYLLNGLYARLLSNVVKNDVIVLDENGVLLYKFGEQGQREGQFNGVCGLAVYGPDMILVCDIGNHRVQVFTPTGQFIRCFGVRGSGIGQMNLPVDVSVTGDGLVLVVEWGGDRVHVWF